jgi:hypothetical protein
MRGRTLALSILLAVGGLAACSDDGGDSADAQPFIDALATTLEDEDEGGPTAEQAECIAERTVEIIGVDTFEEEGITPEDVEGSEGPADLGLELSDDDATAVAEGFFDCGFSFVDSLLNTMAPDASDELRDCVEDNVDQDVVVEGLALDLQGDEEASSASSEAFFTDLTEACPELLGG